MSNDFKKFANQLKKTLQKEAKQMIKQAKEEITDAANKADLMTLQELKIEAEKMYDKLITDYYRYETSTYIRHGQSEPGTCAGINLYKAKNIYIKKNKLFLETNYKLLETYKRDSRKTVFGMISSGLRPMGRKNEPIDWEGNYSGNYISLHETYINDAFEEFAYRFNGMYDRIFDEKMMSLKGRYDFW